MCEYAHVYILCSVDEFAALSWRMRYLTIYIYIRHAHTSPYVYICVCSYRSIFTAVYLEFAALS